jgi:protein tyrosine/serine phosphatase
MLPVLGFCIWAWNSGPLNVRDRLFPRHLAEVYPGFLYRSGQIAPHLIESTLRDLQIDVIVDLNGQRGDQDHEQKTEQETAQRLGIAYHNFALGGSGTGELSEYVGALEVIARADTAGQRVLVHCRAGDRRTGGVVAAYQAIVRREPPSTVLAELGRFSRKPLDRSRLLPYLHDNLDTMQDMLIQRGVLRGVTAGDRPSEALGPYEPNLVLRSQPDADRAAD